MLTLDTIGKIRRDFHVKGRKIKEIARDRRVARNTVRRVDTESPVSECQT